MAKLFKDKTIKKNLEKFVIPNFEGKIEIIKKWFDAYKNKTLHQKTETQCEQAFNQSFFVELLGYTTFPNAIYTIDPKATSEASGQKPDAALGYYSSELNRTIAVVEVKDVNTALDRSQKREGNLSPVQQAFKYKTQFKDCGFVIASNFYEIRLHKDDQLDYEQFTLESLADPKDDYFELRKFYYLLCADNFISKSGKTKTEELLSEIRVDQEKITKNFYKDYKLLRQELIKDIVTNNHVQKSELLLTIEKAQKIIDRIVFVCFCEDKELLPEDTLLTVVKHAENSFSNHWDILKGFFNAIDSGSEKLGIPHGYDGGLFAEDQRLNNLKISDDVCKKFLEFGKYDFSEDLSVNILGHIFEQSISDIEEIKSKTIEGEEADKKKSRRKKEGIFYTPDYIVDYIVKNSLGKYLEEKEEEIKSKNNLKEDILDSNYKKRALATYLEYQSTVRNIKVLDPACGSGAFLVKVFDYLLAENKRVANIIADLNNDQSDFMSSESYIKSLLENNIFGVDLNPESVEITKLSLWLKSAQKDKRLVDLKGNIKCGNSLIDDHEVAGDKAFKWEDEFKEIMENGGFDVIIGNPPYVSANNMIYEDRVYFNKKSTYTTLSGKWDLYIAFIERALLLLRNNGRQCFIVPYGLLNQPFGQKLRKFILDNFTIDSIADLHNYKVFQDATIPVCIPIFIKNKIGQYAVKIMRFSDNHFEKSYDIDIQSYQNANQFMFRTENIDQSKDIVKKMQKHEALGTLYYVSTGAEIHGKERRGSDGVLESGHSKFDVLSDSFIAGYKEYIEGYAIPKAKEGRYCYPERSAFLNYDSSIMRSPKFPELFESEKIIIRGSSGKMGILATYDIRKLYAPHKITIIIKRSDLPKTYKNYLHEDEHANLKYLLALLNSSLMNHYYFSVAGGFIDVYPNSLQALPIPNISKKEQTPFIEKVDLMLSLNKQIYEKLQKFFKLIQSGFKIEKITKKLEKFYELDFDNFVNELKLGKLNLEKKEELLEFFEKYKNELIGLKNQMDATNKEIDEIVFDLYGLTDEESQIITES